VLSIDNLTALFKSWAREVIMMEQREATYLIHNKIPNMHVQGEGWPVRAAELSALMDLGLNDTMIAAYFKISRGLVSALRTHYGLAAVRSRH
jgi:hypothetical protein